MLRLRVRMVCRPACICNSLVARERSSQLLLMESTRVKKMEKIKNRFTVLIVLAMMTSCLFESEDHLQAQEQQEHSESETGDVAYKSECSGRCWDGSKVEIDTCSGSCISDDQECENGEQTRLGYAYCANPFQWPTCHPSQCNVPEPPDCSVCSDGSSCPASGPNRGQCPDGSLCCY